MELSSGSRYMSETTFSARLHIFNTHVSHLHKMPGTGTRSIASWEFNPNSKKSDCSCMTTPIAIAMTMIIDTDIIGVTMTTPIAVSTTVPISYRGFFFGSQATLGVGRELRRSELEPELQLQRLCGRTCAR